MLIWDELSNSLTWHVWYKREEVTRKVKPTRTRTHTHIHQHTHIHTHIHAHTYTHIHTRDANHHRCVVCVCLVLRVARDSAPHVHAHTITPPHTHTGNNYFEIISLCWLLQRYKLRKAIIDFTDDRIPLNSANFRRRANLEKHAEPQKKNPNRWKSQIITDCFLCNHLGCQKSHALKRALSFWQKDSCKSVK